MLRGEEFCHSKSRKHDCGCHFNWNENDRVRKLKCCCEGNSEEGNCDIPLCPYCSVLHLRKMATGVSDKDWVVSEGTKKMPMQYNCIRVS